MEKKLIYSLLTRIKQRGKEGTTRLNHSSDSKFMSTFPDDKGTYFERVGSMSMGYIISKKQDPGLNLGLPWCLWI